MRVGSDSEEEEEEEEEEEQIDVEKSRRREAEKPLPGEISSDSSKRPFPDLLIARALSDSEGEGDSEGEEEEDVERSPRSSLLVREEQSSVERVSPRRVLPAEEPHSLRGLDLLRRSSGSNNNREEEQQQEDSDEEEEMESGRSRDPEKALGASSVSSSSARESIRLWPSRSELFPDLDNDVPGPAPAHPALWDPSSLSLDRVDGEGEAGEDDKVDLTEFLVSLRLQQLGGARERGDPCEALESEIRRHVRTILEGAVSGPLDLFHRQRQQDQQDQDQDQQEQDQDQQEQ